MKVLVAVSAVLLVVATGVMWQSGTRGAEVANVLALPVALVALSLAEIRRRGRRRAADPAVLAGHARDLAREIAGQEARVRQRLLGDTGDARPADVRFDGPDPALVRWRRDGAGDEGSLETITKFYRELRRGRLVVLGEPGAGKTVLAIELLVRLVDELLASPDSADALVPVRLSLPAFLPTGHDVSTPEAVRRQLDRWIAEQLTSSYGQRPEIARELVSRGRVLPILDGLDEMDADDAEPARARAVVGALNLPSGTGLRPVVITSRTGRYVELAEPTVPDVLQDATVVVMRPLTVEQVARWLTHRFPEVTGSGGISERWRPVITRIRRHPTGRLATCLTSPLRLYLAVAAYQDPRSSPRDLIDVPAADLDAHLLAQIVPAATTNYPGPNGSHHDCHDVTVWLRTFAGHLTRMADIGGSGTDMNLPEIWRSTGSPERPGHIVRFVSAAIAGVLAALPISMIVFAITLLVPTARGDAVTVASGTVFAGLVGLIAARTRVRPARLDLRQLLSKTEWPRIALSLLWLFLIGVLVVMEHGWVTGVLITGLLAAIVPVLVVTSTRPVSIDRPSQVVSQGITHDVVRTLVVIVGFSLLLIVMTITLLGSGVYLIAGAYLGLALGLALGSVYVADSPWLRYAVAVLVLRRKRQLPARLARFADWAYAAGLMRLSGTALQFRHREFQTWLTTGLYGMRE